MIALAAAALAAVAGGGVGTALAGRIPAVREARTAEYLSAHLLGMALVSAAAATLLGAWSFPPARLLPALLAVLVLDLISLLAFTRSFAAVHPVAAAAGGGITPVVVVLASLALPGSAGLPPLGVLAGGVAVVVGTLLAATRRHGGGYVLGVREGLLLLAAVPLLAAPVLLLLKTLLSAGMTPWAFFAVRCAFGAAVTGAATRGRGFPLLRQGMPLVPLRSAAIVVNWVGTLYVNHLGGPFLASLVAATMPLAVLLASAPGERGTLARYWFPAGLAAAGLAAALLLS